MIPTTLPPASAQLPTLEQSARKELPGENEELKKQIAALEKKKPQAAARK